MSYSGRDKKENAAHWHIQCRSILEQRGISFQDKGETLVIREPGKVPVDFYPATGRWRDARNPKKTFDGGFHSFLRWYTRQKG